MATPVASSEASVVYVVPALAPALALSDDTRGKGKKVYRKQLIYCGEFEKRTPNQTIQFKVTPPLLHHWRNCFNKFKENGVEVPMPLSHIEDEQELIKDENKHGELLDLEIDKDELGRDSLYSILTTDNEELIKNKDVSIYVPGEYEDIKKNKYYRPIRHVCFTGEPVIKGLEKFQAIAASLSDSDKEIKDSNSMAKIDARNLAKMLGVNPDLNDQAMENAIETAISELLKKAEKQPEPEEKEEPIAAAYVNIAQDSRKTKLQTLVEKAIITPAVKTDLEKIFIDEKRLALSLSLSADKSKVVEKDYFSEVVEALAKNDPVKLREQTGQQTLSLSNEGSKDALKNNPVVKDAEARKAAYATK